MRTCLNCAHVQEQGMFCAKCGKEFATQDTVQQQQVDFQQSNQQTVNSQAPNQQVEKLKEISNGYVGTFMGLLKKPTRSIQTNGNFVNSIISLVLFTFIASFTMYMMVKGLYNEYVGGYYSYFSGESTSVPINILFILFIIIALLEVIAIAAVFFIAKIFIGQASFKQIFVQVTNYYPVIIALVLVGLLLQLVGMMGLALLIVILSLFIAVLLIPLYELVHLMQGKTIKIDYFYVYLILGAVISILIYIVLNTFVSSYIEELKGEFLDIF